MFTVAFLNSLQPKKTPYRVYEKATRAGFGIQTTPKGVKTFFYGYKVKVIEDDKEKLKQRFMKLGGFGNISLKEAGDLWQAAHNIKQSGNDPQTIRDNQSREASELHAQAVKAKLAEAKQGTYEQLLNSYIEYLKDNKKRSFANVSQGLNANAYKIIAKSAKAKDVTPNDIDYTLTLIEERGAHVMANKVRAYLSAAYGYGIKSDKSRTRKKNKTMYGIISNPVRDVLKSEIPEKTGTRFLDESEINHLWYDLSNTKMSPQRIAILQLMIATGQREEEVIRLNINNIDFDSMLWELEKTKNGRPFVVVLPEIAIDLINGLTADSKGFYFVSDSTGELIRTDSISQAVGRYCTSKEFNKFVPKDLRRTWKTLAGKAGISKIDRDIYQNHAIGSKVSTEHYDMYDYLDEKRHTAIKWNTYLNSILNNFESNIIPLKRQRNN